MPTKTTAGIIADLVTLTGGSVRSEKFAQLALIALNKAIDHAPTYNFRETYYQDLVGIPAVNAWDSKRFEIAGRDILPYPPAKQHQPIGVVGYQPPSLYRPNFGTLEPGIGADGAVNALVTTMNFDVTIPGPVGPAVQRLVASGPLTAGTYTLTQNGHTTGANNWNDGLAAIQTRLDAAGILYTAVGGPLTTPWNIGVVAKQPGADGAFTVTPTGITGGVLSIESVQVGTTPAQAATKCRFWCYRRATLPASETAIIPLDDVYLDIAPLMFMHEALSGTQLAGDQSNHAYQSQQLAKQLTMLKRNRTNIRVNNRTWRAYDVAMGNSPTGRTDRFGR